MGEGPHRILGGGPRPRLPDLPGGPGGPASQDLGGPWIDLWKVPKRPLENPSKVLGGLQQTFRPFEIPSKLPRGPPRHPGAGSSLRIGILRAVPVDFPNVRGPLNPKS